nr:alkylphosphonate utilization protein [uncultured Mucilaginibacter sp.]
MTISNCCQLCKSTTDTSIYTVPPANHPDNEITICGVCLGQIAKGAETDAQYWRFLSEAMWSEVPAVQVVAWRMLSRLKNEAWAADNLDMLYLDEETQSWAKAANDDDVPAVADDVHRDSLGAQLFTGDTVVLTRSLDVKGSPLNAKMGTVVKNIRIVASNTDQVEGKIEGQQIVILTKYLRKQKN